MSCDLQCAENIKFAVYVTGFVFASVGAYYAFKGNSQKASLNAWRNTIAGFIAVVFGTLYIDSLKAPRILTEPQKKGLLDQLRQDAGVVCRVKAFAGDNESIGFAIQLGSLLKDAGWVVEGPLLYITDNSPPEGVWVGTGKTDVDNADKVMKHIFDSLKLAGIAEVGYGIDPERASDCIRRNCIVLEVGLKPGIWPLRPVGRKS